MRLCYHKNLRKRRTDADPLIKYLLSQASSAYETGISVIDTKVLSYKTHRASLRQSPLRMSQKPFILCSEMGILTLCMLVSQLIICFLGKHNPNLEALAVYTTGCIVKGGSINLYCTALGNQKCLYQRSIIGEILCNVLLASQH